jgi:methionyl-tRNA formyltransferase
VKTNPKHKGGATAQKQIMDSGREPGQCGMSINEQNDLHVGKEL